MEFLEPALRNRMNRFVEYICRMPRTRGFGVQSPTAYAFLRRVVKEKGFLANCSAVDVYPYGASQRERLLYRLRCAYPNVVVMPYAEWSAPMLADSVLGGRDSDTVLVLLDINQDRQSREEWRRLVADKRCFQVFDMLNLGVVFLDPTKPKQFFKVNY